VQLQGDPQEEVDVERVVVGDERPGRRASGDRVQRGPSISKYPWRLSVLRNDCTHGCGP
jgi:hypothetical protein